MATTAAQTRPETKRAKDARWRAWEKGQKAKADDQVRGWARRQLDVAEHDFREWETRHPDKAIEEIALRRRRRTIRKEFGHATYGTPETRFHASQTYEGSLARLYRRGDITVDQLAWAVEIATIAAAIGSVVGVRTMNLERIDQGRGDGGFFEKLGRVRAEVAYTRWRAALAEPGPVLAMIVDDCGVAAAARRWRMRDTRAKKLLGDALDRWGDTIGAVCQEIDAAELLAAQAGILGG